MKYPIPQSAKETKRLNSKNEFGCIIASTKTSNGAPKNEIPRTHPEKINAANVIAGASTINKLKKPNPITAQIARKTFPVVALVVTFSI